MPIVLGLTPTVDGHTISLCFTALLNELNTNVHVETLHCYQVFSYEDTAQVSSLSPTFVKSTGGTRITLKGSGFPRRGDVRCRFGEGSTGGEQTSSTLSPPPTSYAYVVSDEELACTVPSSGLGPEELGSAQVFLATAGEEFTPTKKFVNFVPTMELSLVIPEHVDEQGEHDVLLGGTKFPDVPGLACRFGGRASNTVPALWLRSTAVRCVAPPLSPGAVLVEVTFNGVDFVASPQMLTVDTSLTVSSITPLAGPISGGTEVTITGTGFGVDTAIGGSGSTGTLFSCLFGESRITAVATVLSPGNVSCRTPPGFGMNAGGLVSITVARHHGGGSFGELSFAPMPLEFFYLREAVLAGVTPDSGPMVGGTRVALSGLREEISFLRAAGVEPDMRCRFGAATDAAVIMQQGQAGDENEAFCVTPPSLGGADQTAGVRVTVSLNGGVDVLISDAIFFYFETPEVVSVDPSAVSVQGGSVVTLEGRNFPDTAYGVRCIVGPGAQVLEGIRVSSTTLECLAPQHSPGFALVSATFNGVDVATSTALLEYRENLSITSISPSYSAVTAGAKVTLRGTGFVNSSLLCFRWGRSSSDGVNDEGPSSTSGTWSTSFLEFVNGTAATFTAPHVAMDSDSNEADSVELRLQVSNNGLDFTTVDDSLRFAIAGRPRVEDVFPRYGSGAGSTTVTIVGTGFVPAATLCRFGLRERDGSAGVRTVDEPLKLVLADVRNSTHLTCATPAELDHLVGEYFIEVVTGAATSEDALATAAAEDVYERSVDPLATAGFTFIAAAGVTAVEPAVLPESGSTIVTIEGFNLTRTGLEACRFGGETVVSGRWWNESAIKCQAPPLPPGSVSLELTLNGGADWLAVPSGLRYEPDRFLYALSPSAGPLSGGSLVMVTGVGFAGFSGGEDAPGNFYCSFGNLEVSCGILRHGFREPETVYEYKIATTDKQHGAHRVGCVVERSAAGYFYFCWLFAEYFSR